MDNGQIGTEVELRDLESQPVLSIRGIIPVASLGETMGERIETLAEYLRRSGMRATGPFFVRYHTFGTVETDMETGVPVAPAGETVRGEGQVTAGELPGGPAVATWHEGPHTGLGDAYARIDSWLREHNREPQGPAWEVYHWIDLSREGDATAGDGSRWRTRLVQPVK